MRLQSDTPTQIPTQVRTHDLSFSILDTKPTVQAKMQTSTKTI